MSAEDGSCACPRVFSDFSILWRYDWFLDTCVKTKVDKLVVAACTDFVFMETDLNLGLLGYGERMT